MIKILKSKILSKKQKEILKGLMKFVVNKNIYCAGGTALAMQIEHRESDDFDFFVKGRFSFNKLYKQIINEFGKNNINLEILNNDTLNIEIENFKVQFLTDYYKVTGELIESDLNIKIASIKQIGLMKLLAIMNRGSRKDFIDIYFICKDNIRLMELLNHLPERYPGLKEKGNLLTALIYFEDAEKEPMPKMIKKVKWQNIKKYITKEVLEINKKLEDG